MTNELLNQLHAEPSNSLAVHQLLAQIPGSFPADQIVGSSNATHDQPRAAEDGALSSGPSTELVKHETPSTHNPVGTTFSHFGSQLFSNQGGSFEEHDDVDKEDDAVASVLLALRSKWAAGDIPPAPDLVSAPGSDSAPGGSRKRVRELEGPELTAAAAVQRPSALRYARPMCVS